MFQCTHFITRVITGSEIFVFVFVGFVVTSMNFVLSSFILRPNFCASLSVCLQASLREFRMQLREN
jgi:hypothetical protein